MSKEIWIDRDETYEWYDFKPTHDALGNGGEVSEHIAKVAVSNEEYAAFQKYCEEAQYWQNRLSELYIANKHPDVRKGI